jgi:beta-phosphoglucomutase
MHRFRACLFDFDGVLVNSEPLHAEAKRQTLEVAGIAYPPSIFDDFKGRTDRAFFTYVVEHLSPAGVTLEALEARKRDVYAELFAQVEPVVGALEFLEFARNTFAKLALVTSATRRDYGLADARYSFSAHFDTIVTGEDTRLHKPDPEPYLTALERLGVSSTEALVVEDAPNGIIAATRAGCTVAAITTGFEPAALLEAGADVIVASFAELRRFLER